MFLVHKLDGKMPQRFVVNISPIFTGQTGSVITSITNQIWQLRAATLEVNMSLCVVIKMASFLLDDDQRIVEKMVKLVNQAIKNGAWIPGYSYD